MKQRKRVAVLISGRGSNMLALANAARNPAYPAEIVGVLSDVSEAPGLESARRLAIEAVAVPRDAYDGRAAHEAAVNAQLDAWSVDLVCLAGYMRLLSPDFTRRWAGRMINIHPSLLPRHKGLDTHRRAIEAGDAHHGCSVHYVTAGMDDGPVIAQATVAILPGDNPETLAARVLAEEHRLYPDALALVAEGRA